ncbi:L-threonylcarbamoyladenylate synthase [Prochlorococcus marinus]|uniref:L-threonylcarbamoyladenylate synthase n=1 Tax=Prochlorococcus marinus XMU1408 TaxID=2213228 RepID=A0A318R4H0_PROMR|nr:L-threonylcarbamoyladenylate synthase [Prochlorococcus marinus]MBW3041387.1 translation factor [Prochlorococcus marinus str. XMU1408]PYE02551.1 translation factor [Prochlorococcus marinus XMU1408]
MQLAVKNKMVADQLHIPELSLQLKKGSLALFPTDTLPAICSYPKYSNKIWNIKKRPLNKPLILMGGCLEDLFEFVKPCAIEDGLKIAKIYWPGALTIILPTIGNVSKYMNCNSDSLGFRVPALRLARDLLMKTGPLATTSANISGKPPVKDAIEASVQFPGIPILAPVPWPNASGIASTVIEWKDGKWDILRAGSIVLN